MTPENNEKELMDMWQAASFSNPADAAQMARAIERRTQRFDRALYWRNFREYAAGVLVGVFFISLAVRFPQQRLVALSGLVAVGVVLFHLWRKHRDTPPEPDESSDLRSFHQALVARYDHQIRLLRDVKYWYVLPQYLWLLVVAGRTALVQPLAGALLFVLATAVMGAVTWLNQSYGVRRLEQEKQKALEMLNGRLDHP